MAAKIAKNTHIAADNAIQQTYYSFLNMDNWISVQGL